MVLIGNKCDVDSREKEVPEEEGRSLAEELGIPFFLASAKYDINVSRAIEVSSIFFLQ